MGSDSHIEEPEDGVEETIDIRFPDLLRFLLDASSYFSLGTVCFRTNRTLPNGTPARIRITLPVLEERVVCLARVIQKAPNGLVFEINEWEDRNDERLWRYVALTWSLLRAAAHPKFQKEPPGPAAQVDPKSVICLEPVATSYQLGTASRSLSRKDSARLVESVSGGPERGPTSAPRRVSRRVEPPKSVPHAAGRKPEAALSRKGTGQPGAGSSFGPGEKAGKERSSEQSRVRSQAPKGPGTIGSTAEGSLREEKTARTGAAVHDKAGARAESHDEPGAAGAETSASSGASGAHERVGASGVEAHERVGDSGADAHVRVGDSGADAHERVGASGADAHERVGDSGVEAHEGTEASGADAHERAEASGADAHVRVGASGAEARERAESSGADAREKKGLAEAASEERGKGRPVAQEGARESAPKSAPDEEKGGGTPSSPASARRSTRSIPPSTQRPPQDQAKRLAHAQLMRTLPPGLRHRARVEPGSAGVGLPLRRPLKEAKVTRSSAKDPGPPRSRLEDRPLALLLADAMLARYTGWIEVFSREISRRIRLEKGDVFQIEQRPFADIRLLATTATAIGINWDRVRAAEGQMAREDAPEKKLLELKLLNNDSATRLLSRRLSVQLARAIEEGWEGEAAMLPAHSTEGPLLEPMPPLPLARLIWDGLRARVFAIETAEAQALATTLRGSFVWSSQYEFPASEATSRVEEQGFIHQCREDASSLARQLAAEGISDRTLLATCWSLQQLGLLEVRAERLRPVDDGDLEENFAKIAKEMKKKSHFEVLELHWSVHPDEIEPAYHRMKEHFEAYVESETEEVGRLAAGIIRRVEAAYEILSDDRKRQEYRKNLVGKDLGPTVQHALAQGELFDMRDEREMALRRFELAVDLMPHRNECTQRLKRQLDKMGPPEHQ